MSESGVLRQTKLDLRNKIEEKKREELSGVITEKLLAMDEVRRAYSFFVYVSFRSEVSTRILIEYLLGKKKQVSVPITHVDKKYMEAIQIENTTDHLTPGYCGIPEPVPDRQKNHIVSPENIDIVIVPGSVFDERGGRFGYGGGYYDKFLSRTPHATKIGLAFDLQVVERAPLQPHDELLDYVITEKRIILGR